MPKIENMAKIYLIYNIENGKKYVGQTTGNVAQRFCQHIDGSYRKKESLTQFHKEMKESGEKVFEIFKYRILEECENEDRFKKEIEYISKIKPEYNEDLKVYYLLSIQNQIIDEYNNGKTITQIRQKYRCRHDFISNLLKTNGIKIEWSRNQFSKKIYLFDQQGKVIKHWNGAGRCSAELGIDRSNIRLCCLKNTKYNTLYFSAEGKHFKYNQDIPKNMYEIIEIKTGTIFTFKSKEALTDFFQKKFPEKKILYGQLVRNRKTVYGYKIKKLYEFRN